MSRMRVMHLVVGGDIGGAERLLFDLVRRPEESECDHEIALFTHNPRLQQYLASSGVPVHSRGRSAESPFGYLARSLGPRDTELLAMLLVRRQTAIVHTHTFGSHVLGTRAARRAGLPQLRTEHHVMHYADASTRYFTRWAAARTQRFVAVSEYVRKTLLRKMPELGPRLTVVHNGIDLDHWTSPVAPPAPEPDTKPLRVAIVCRLTAWKRVHLALEAARLASARLVVVGDGEERGRLEARARQLGVDAEFVGFQADPRPFIAGADVTLSTSQDEPLGLSILESLAMERPVVALRGGGVPEILEHGVSGVLVDEPTAGALAVALSSLARRRAELPAMGALGRRRVAERCTVGRMAEAYAVAYRAAASDASGRP